MTKLVLSPATSQLLEQIARETTSNHDAVESLKAALLEQTSRPKMTTQSPAVPSTGSTETSVVLDHRVLIGLASWAHSEDASSSQSAVDPVKLKLSSLVVGSHVYIPPKPAFERVSCALVSLLSRIRQLRYLQLTLYITAFVPSL